MCNYTFILDLVDLQPSPRTESRTEVLESELDAEVTRVEHESGQSTEVTPMKQSKRKNDCGEDGWIFEQFGSVDNLQADPDKYFYCMLCEWKKDEFLPGV